MKQTRTDILNFINSISKRELNKNFELYSKIEKLRFYLDDYTRNSFLINERREMIKYLNKTLV